MARSIVRLDPSKPRISRRPRTVAHIRTELTAYIAAEARGDARAWLEEPDDTDALTTALDVFSLLRSGEMGEPHTAVMLLPEAEARSAYVVAYLAEIAKGRAA
jgi:hypothetical protein